MEHSITVLMLAGGLRPAPLRHELGLPLLRMPIGRHGTLLDHWLRAARAIPECRQIRIVVNNKNDATYVRRMLRQRNLDGPVADVVSERTAWRGAGGILRDFSDHLNGRDLVLAAEASCLPPTDLDPIIRALEDGTAAGAVAVGDNEQPAGVYALYRAALELIPTIGYFDLKEQLFPMLHRRDYLVRRVPLVERVRRVRDRDAYLDAVRESLLLVDKAGTASPRCAARAHVSHEARLLGCSIVEDYAVVARGAVVHDSVIFERAVIEADAVVVRSIVGPGSRIPFATRLTEATMAVTDCSPVGASKQLTGTDAGAGLSEVELVQ